MPDTWARADMNPDDPGSQGYGGDVDRPELSSEELMEEVMVPVSRDLLGALAVEVLIEQAWLKDAPEWAHTELGRRFQLVLDHAKAVLGE